MRDHIAQLCTQTGKTSQELGITLPEITDDPEIPPAGELLWTWFWELDQGRASSGFAPQPLAWTDIAGWAQVTNTTMTPGQIFILRQMDKTYLSTSFALRPKNKE